MRKLISSFVFSILLLSGNGWGATYYVDQSGGDNAKNGLSPANAWKTIAKVNASNFAAGDSILFKRGETWSSEQLTPPSNGTAGNLITFGAYGAGNAPVLDNNYGDPTGVGIVIGYDRSYITIRDLEVKNWSSSLIYIRGSQYITIDNNILHGSNLRAIYSLGNDTGPVWNDYITITNNTIYDIGDWGETAAADIQINTYTRRHTVTNNVMHGDGSTRGVDGVTTDSGQANLAGGSGHIVSGNTSYGHDENCYDFKGGGQSAAGEGRTRVFNNICYDSRTDGINIAEGTHGLDIGPGNLIYANHGAGITFNGTRTHAWDNTLGDVDIFYNIIRDNELSGIYVNDQTDGGDINIYNNVITNNGLPPNKGSGNVGLIINSNGVTLKNNIIHLNGVGRYNNGYPDYAIYVGDGITITSDYNIINTPTGVGGMYYYYYGRYRTWSEIRGTYGLETHSITGNPLFTNIAGKNFTLTSSSPAINAGVNVGLTTDYLGNPVPFGSAPDIGAYEYISPKVLSPPAILHIITQ